MACQAEAEACSASGASGHFRYVEPRCSRAAKDGAKMRQRLLDLVPPTEQDLLATATDKLAALKAAKRPPTLPPATLPTSRRSSGLLGAGGGASAAWTGPGQGRDGAPQAVTANLPPRSASLPPI
jgi:hypothetical protein